MKCSVTSEWGVAHRQLAVLLSGLFHVVQLEFVCMCVFVCVCMCVCRLTLWL
jgi:hypothetical protein